MSSKPICSFLIFCEENRPLHKRPDRGNSEVTSILGAEWRSLDQETKDQYIKKAVLRKQLYNKTHPYPQTREVRPEDKYKMSFKITKNTSTPVTKPRKRQQQVSNHLSFVDNSFYVYLESWLSSNKC
mmetsp:Transcript_3602/g.4463  ORF Transcript_3602/g.4463 Transcript_3602/m.4463 type:complete len:127 (-) Transcript_3602:51-431(-)